MNEKRVLIRNTLLDTISKFLYYDRKEDSELPVGAIEEACNQGTISRDELVELFRTKLYMACISFREGKK